MTNAEIVEAMKGHHASLMASLQQRVDALADDVLAGNSYRESAAAVAEFLEREIYPHAAAEEEAIYPLAARTERLAALVEAMLGEHRHLLGGARAIAAAPDGSRAVGLAQAVSTVFRLHAGKENDLILPALSANPRIDLEAVLAHMHSLLESEPGASDSHDAHDEDGVDPDLVDVRPLPPAQRHAVIFSTFDHLRPGQAFELVNDHDPKPLRYQLAAEHPEAFTWDYLESGPRTWRVRIGRVAA